MFNNFYEINKVIKKINFFFVTKTVSYATTDARRATPFKIVFFKAYTVFSCDSVRKKSIKSR